LILLGKYACTIQQGQYKQATLLNLNYLLEEAIDEVDENLDLKPKELSEPLSNPGLHHVHLGLDISTYHEPQAQNHQIRESH
jgi:hypothetical protein